MAIKFLDMGIQAAVLTDPKKLEELRKKNIQIVEGAEDVDPDIAVFYDDKEIEVLTCRVKEVNGKTVWEKVTS